MKSTRYGSFILAGSLAAIGAGVAETMFSWGACFRTPFAAIAPGTLAGSDVGTMKAIVAAALATAVALAFTLSLFSETRRRVIVPAAALALTVLVALALKHAPVDVVSSTGTGTRQAAGSSLTVWELIASAGCGAFLVSLLLIVGGGRRMSVLPRRRLLPGAAVLRLSRQ